MHRSVLLDMVPFGLVVVVTQAHGSIGHAVLAICLGFSVVALYYTFTARCPHCRTGLLFNLITFGVRLWIPAWFNSCPTCGFSFDTQRFGLRKPSQMTKSRPRTIRTQSVCPKTATSTPTHARILNAVQNVAYLLRSHNSTRVP
jgi:hypothetical protein